MSGNFAIVVWNNFQAALPKSAFTVSFPILPMIASPFSTSSSTLTWCIGTELKVAFRFLGPENVQLRSETRPTAAISRRRKRLFGTVPGVGIWRPRRGETKGGQNGIESLGEITLFH